MHTQLRLAALAVSLCVVAPAFAMGVTDPRTEKGAKAGGAESAPAAPAKKICARFPPMTGTRIPEIECRTRAEWGADGYKFKKSRKARAAEKAARDAG